jgi:DNA repair exonuclease SbcCD nuclease subunit
MLKFLHAADVHLDSPLRGLARSGIRVFLVAGNHDAASQITKVLQPPANVKVFSTRRPETEVLEELGVALHGQGFAHAAVSDDLSAGFPAAIPHLWNIGLLHTSLDGRPNHDPYAPTTVERLRSRGYQYWALGHVHEREVVATDPWIVFPGNLQGRHARETGGKGATLVTVDDRGVALLEHRDLDVFRWADRAVDLGAVGTASEALDRVRGVLDRELAGADGRPLAVRLRLVGSSPVHAEIAGAPAHWREEIRSLANGFGEGALWIEKVRFETRPAADLAAAFDREDALGGLLRAVRDLATGPASGVDLPDLVELAAGFSELRTRLPAELLDDREALDPGNPDQLRGRLDEVKDLLLARLLAHPESA